MQTEVVIAGFGGQGVLFAGQMLAFAAMDYGKEVTWIPSYGPEMRGGTANCSVCLSDEPIGSPLVLEPDVLVAMNQPSLDKFAGDVVPGGKIILDSTMISRLPERDDVAVYPVPATQLAEESGLKGLASVILVGKLLREIGFCDPMALDAAIVKSVPAKKQHLLGPNRKAFEIGMTNEDGESSPVCSLPDGWTAE